MELFPCEIWEQIVQNLAAYDLINFCKISDEFSYLLRDKHIVINFDLGGCFEIYDENLYDYISLHVGYDHIKYLNINKLYWIELEDIRNIISLLTNLEELCALDTSLGMRDEDVTFYKKLKKLAISVEADQFTSPREVYRENLISLKSFCIKFVSKYRADFRRIYYMFFNELRRLNELWLYDADDLESQPLRYDYIVCNLRNLNKLVIKSKTSLSLLDYKPFGLVKIYGRQRNNITTICYVRTTIPEILNLRRTSLSEVFESRTVKSWDIIQSFLTETPCGFKNSLGIYNTKTMKHTEFNELTFYHTRACNATFVNSVVDILLSKHARGLKKLCLTLCILQEGNVEQNEKKNVFRHIINNCPFLSELEIITCLKLIYKCHVQSKDDIGLAIFDTGFIFVYMKVLFSSELRDVDTDYMKIPCYSSTIIGAYELISNLKYLKKLTLEIPAYLNGFFFKAVFLTCPELQSLQILSKETNEDLNSVIYSHINYAQRLNDFRFENIHIDLDRLFSALNKVLNSRLRRIVIKCDYEHSQQLWPIEKFLKRNNNLILLAIVVSKYNRHQTNQLQELLNGFKDHPAKLYIAKTDLHPEEDIFLPEAHKDILYWNSDVSVLHLSDF